MDVMPKGQQEGGLCSRHRTYSVDGCSSDGTVVNVDGHVRESLTLLEHLSSINIRLRCVARFTTFITILILKDGSSFFLTLSFLKSPSPLFSQNPHKTFTFSV